MTLGVDAAELRRVYPRVLMKTLALTKSLPDAEDALHDALERALASFQSAEAPDSIEAWLCTVAANCHRDRLRRVQGHARNADALATLGEMNPWLRIALGEPEVARGWKDDLLGLLFACCHPALESGESAALALATVIGLSNREIARAFLVTERSMEQRLTRARQRLRERGDYDGVPPERAGDRLDAVLRVVYLLFNEGYWSNDDEAPIRADLARLAIGLGRSLVGAIADQPEPVGLLALMLLHDARRGARFSAQGLPVALPDQDRARFDRPAIEAACSLLDRALALGNPGPFQVEAAISAVHCRALVAHQTDWREIAVLYQLLESFRPTPAVRVNRAFALSRATGALSGLALLERGDLNVEGYSYVHLVRGTLLAELGRTEAARQSLLLALEHARNREEADQIKTRIDALPPNPI